MIRFPGRAALCIDPGCPKERLTRSNYCAEHAPPWNYVAQLPLTIVPFAETFEEGAAAVAAKQLGPGYISADQLSAVDAVSFVAIVGTRVVGVAYALDTTVSDILREHPKLKPEHIPFAVSELRLGYVASIAVDSLFSGRGIGMTMLAARLEALESRGICQFLGTAWKSASRGVHVGGLLTRAGFVEGQEIPEYWHGAGQPDELNCPECSPYACRCAAVVYSLTGPVGLR